MDLRKRLDKLVDDLNKRKLYVDNEESTKQALILPFIKELGFNVYNPQEVKPEYSADFGNKKGERVDYALFKDEEPIIFIEAKPINEKLGRHDAQLARYFNATPELKFSILSNGFQYKLFTDLNVDNMMDEVPFYEFNLEDLKEADYEVIEKFCKENFKKSSLIEYAQELVYVKNINSSLKELLRNPTDDFVRFLVKDINNQRMTNAVIEKFRPLVKKSVNQSIMEIFVSGLTSVEGKNQEPSNINPQELGEEEGIITAEEEKIVTTEEELRAFDITEEILLVNEKDTSVIKHRDNNSYFPILYKVTTKWIIRLYLNGPRKNIITKLDIESHPELFEGLICDKVSAGTRIFIEDVEDLYKLEKIIVRSYEQYE